MSAYHCCGKPTEDWRLKTGSGAPGQAWEEEGDVETENLEAAPRVRVPPGKVDHHPDPSVAV
jgi:hypothetical protein